MQVIVDVEGNGLLPELTQMWCIITTPPGEHRFDVFVPDAYYAIGATDKLTLKENESLVLYPLSHFKDYAKQIDSWVGHNIINYDARAMKKLGYVGDIPTKNLIDTMVLSQITGPSRQGGHSLKSWGMRFEDYKGDWEDFSMFDWAMVDYCIQDVRVTRKLYEYMVGNTKNFSKFSVRLEHAVRGILDEMQENGFYLDEARAHTLYTEIKLKCEAMEKQIQIDFPPRKSYFKKLYPRTTADGKMHGQDARTISNNQHDVIIDDMGETYYHLYTWEEFNVRSTSQIVQRMNELGWKPVVFNEPTAKMIEQGKEHGSPQVCEENFATLPDDAPESAKTIAQWFLYEKRLQKLDEWFRELNPKTGCIHGRVFGCGAHTMRMTHRAPNMANISKVKTEKLDDGNEILLWGERGEYSTDMRACFTTRDPKKRRLVGVDLSGIQLRAFAHYAGNKEYAEQILSGDIHAYNRGILDAILAKFVASFNPKDIIEYMSMNDKQRRNVAKTFIYAYLFGAGNKKVGQILGASEKMQNKVGKFVKEEFVSAISGLEAFKKEISHWAKQGFMVALDGRLIGLPSEHIALSVALQSFEAIVMKYALVLATKKIKERGLDALLVGIIHDECQWDVAKEHADEVGKLVVECMEETGVYLKSNLPLTGEYNIGLTWADSH